MIRISGPSPFSRSNKSPSHSIPWFDPKSGVRGSCCYGRLAHTYGIDTNLQITPLVGCEIAQHERLHQAENAILIGSDVVDDASGSYRQTGSARGLKCKVT